MKRIVAKFSLILIMITAIQPVIAMHYCGDELSSLQIYQTNGIEDFCCDDTEHHDVLTSGNHCCDTEILKLSTDKYQTIVEQFFPKILSLSSDVAGLTSINHLVTSKTGSSTLITTLKFPPKGHYLKDVSILTYICIYRI